MRQFLSSSNSPGTKRGNKSMTFLPKPFLAKATPQPASFSRNGPRVDHLFLPPSCTGRSRPRKPSPTATAVPFPSLEHIRTRFVCPGLFVRTNFRPIRIPRKNRGRQTEPTSASHMTSRKNSCPGKRLTPEPVHNRTDRSVYFFFGGQVSGCSPLSSFLLLISPCGLPFTFVRFRTWHPGQLFKTQRRTFCWLFMEVCSEARFFPRCARLCFFRLIQPRSRLARKSLFLWPAAGPASSRSEERSTRAPTNPPGISAPEAVGTSRKYCRRK